MAKITARGMKISYSTTSGGTYTDIANLGDVTLDLPKREMRDMTTHNTTGDYRDMKPDGMSEGSVSSSVILENPEHASHAWLSDNLTSVGGTLAYFKVTVPKVGTVYSFSGYVTEFSVQGPVSGAASAQFSISIGPDLTKSSS